MGEVGGVVLVVLCRVEMLLDGEDGVGRVGRMVVIKAWCVVNGLSCCCLLLMGDRL